MKAFKDGRTYIQRQKRRTRSIEKKIRKTLLADTLGVENRRKGAKETERSKSKKEMAPTPSLFLSRGNASLSSSGHNVSVRRNRGLLRNLEEIQE